MIGVTVPRWVAEPVVGVGAVRVVVPDGLLGELRLVAAGIGVAPAAVLLAAHARVLAALTGEPRVTTGSVAEPGGPARPCVLSTDTGSWHSLVAVAGRPAVVPDAEFETVCDPHAIGLAPVGAEVLRVGAALEPGRGALTVAYRTDVLDADAADRIAGYHLTALRLLAADPDADPTAGRLLSSAELRRQFDLLAGPTRPRPDRRVHELFEDRARRHPDAVAAVCGGRQIGYGTLNARANRLARALRARGIGAEDVVAVVTERNLDWLVAVLAVFKAGGAYLPIEPHFPADRVAAMLERAGCRLVVTEPGSDRCLPAAGPPRLLVGQADREGHASGDFDVPVAADQLAYIYFTSGSTGAPKGAMCEHAGMLNHLYAKIEDLGLDETAVVAQTAPQCFDISLWQLVAALLVGGRTVIVDQAMILDVARFVDTVVASGVTVAQLVPSYLEVVLGLLAGQPRRLGALRCVSVTGETVKKELVTRWFAHTSGIALVNAYGLTETSDDTNHEVMHRVPDTDRVPLGRPVPNVRIYVVDERLDPVPLGAAGRDRLLRGVRRARLRQRPGAHRAGVPARSAPAGATDLPQRRPRALAARRPVGVPRPPRHPGQDPRLPDRDRRDRQRAAAGAGGPGRRGGGRRAPRPRPRRVLHRAGAAAGGHGAGPAGCDPAGLHGAGRRALAADAAAHRQRQDRPQGADRARAAAGRHRHLVRPDVRHRVHPDRTTAGRGLVDRTRHPGRGDRPRRQLLRPRRQLTVGGQAGADPEPGGRAPGRHPEPDAGRPGRSDRPRPGRAVTTPVARCVRSPGPRCRPPDRRRLWSWSTA